MAEFSSRITKLGFVCVDADGGVEDCMGCGARRFARDGRLPINALQIRRISLSEAVWTT